MQRVEGGGFGWKVALLGACLLVAYNLNGREIGSYDSQPTKMLAREIVVGGTLTLDGPVAAQPQLAERPGFQLDRHGHYRSAYPIVPALMAATVLGAAGATGLVDARAPLAHDLGAKATASLLVTLAVVLLTLCARRWTAADGPALWLGVGLGLGTNWWALASQTLWQHETAALGIALAVWATARPGRGPTTSEVTLAAAGLALAAGARLQTTPAAAVLAGWVLLVRPRWSTLVALSPLALVVCTIAAVNWHWFGHPLGAVPRLEALHPAVHGVSGSWSATPWVGLAGLLVSPNRGLLVFSPIVLAAALGARRAWRDGRRGVLAWLAAAAGAQWLVYGAYSVWGRASRMGLATPSTCSPGSCRWALRGWAPGTRVWRAAPSRRSCWPGRSASRVSGRSATRTTAGTRTPSTWTATTRGCGTGVICRSCARCARALPRGTSR